MKRLFYSIIILFAIVSCGKKGDPLPASAFNIPAPSDFEFTVEEDGIKIYNNSPSYVIAVEKRKDDGSVGLSARTYRTLSYIKPNSSFLDSNVDVGETYIYRVYNYLASNDVLSSGVRRVISYKGSVKINNVAWHINDDKICISVDKEVNVASFAILLNGVNQELTKDSCYIMPEAYTFSLTIIPYTLEGESGLAYTTDIVRDITGLLLPPQNVKLYYTDNSITVTWDKNSDVDEFKIISHHGDTYKSYHTKSNIITDIVDSGCINYELSSVKDEEVSVSLYVQACI